MKNHLLFIIAFVVILAACNKSKYEPAYTGRTENAQRDLSITAD